MGETIKEPKKRPVAKVEFAYAELFIPGLTQPKILVDRTGTKPMSEALDDDTLSIVIETAAKKK